MTNPNDSAFAKSAFYHENGGVDSPEKGLTKREYIAALAMQGIISSPHTSATWEKIAEVSVKMSDLLIKQLNKSELDGKADER